MVLAAVTEDDARFDVIVAVGSTLAEAVDRDGFDRAARAALRPGGQRMLAESGMGPIPDADVVRSLGDLWLACSTRR